MRNVLFVSALLAFLVGVSSLAAAKSAIHEIEAFLLFLISATCLSGAGVVEAVTLLHKTLTPDK